MDFCWQYSQAGHSYSTTTAVGMWEIFCHFSFVIIILLGTSQLYICSTGCFGEDRQPSCTLKEAFGSAALNLGLEPKAFFSQVFLQDFAQRWNIITLLQKAFSYMKYKRDMQEEEVMAANI